MTDNFVPLLEISDLSIQYADKNGYQSVVHHVSLSITQGETVVLVGESGSGKSTISHSIIGLLPSNGKISSGSIKLNGEEVSRWSQKRLQTIRGSAISLIPQDPVSSLNPIKTVGAQVSEMFVIHQPKQARHEIENKVMALFKQVGLSNPELRFNQYPHELSGGMRQRVLIAMAIALKPQLIIADEPTSALDVTVQKQILELIEDLKSNFGTAVLLVTHDLSIAADYGNRIVVLKKGEIQEQGCVENILLKPQSNYTKQLLSDIPSFNMTLKQITNTTSVSKNSIIEVKNITQKFKIKGGKNSEFIAVDNVSFEIKEGTTHAIVGESGSGKTTTIRCILGIEKPKNGEIWIDDQEMTQLKGESLRLVRKKIQLVQQNPFTSLDPKQTIYQIIEEPLLNFERLPKSERMTKVMLMLEKVGLSAEIATRKPLALSGGQRQRVAIARALIIMPKIVVFDEAVSALDVTVQAQIIALLLELQSELNLTYLFISHDLAVVRQIAHTVSVMQAGKVVENGDIETVFNDPKNDYTKKLIDAIPGKRQRIKRDGLKNHTYCDI